MLNFTSIKILLLLLPFIVFFFLSFFSSSFNLFFISSTFHMDTISFLLILLSSWISIIMLFSNKKSLTYNLMISFLFYLLMLSFLFSNTILFYIMFEAVLIPTLFMILNWGYQPERLQAAFYMIMYTIVASLPLLILLLLFKKSLFLLSFLSLLPFSPSFISSTFFMIAFFVKLPLFIFHLWLPKAHVEAPLEGSMILAAILLKLGSYGIFRFMNIFSSLNKNFLFISLSVAAISSFLTAILCVRQNDMKSLIAYSSVSHMSLIILAIFSLSQKSFMISMMIMMSHGFSSSSLFFLANMIYLNSNSRNMILSKGIYSCFPFISLIWFLSIMNNMGAPPFFSLASEILSLSCASSFSFIFLPSLMLMLFFSIIYSITLFFFSNKTIINSISNSFSPPFFSLISLVIAHLFPSFIIMLNLFIFI